LLENGIITSVESDCWILNVANVTELRILTLRTSSQIRALEVTHVHLIYVGEAGK
jgi:hypothetical protein